QHRAGAGMLIRMQTNAEANRPFGESGIVDFLGMTAHLPLLLGGLAGDSSFSSSSVSLTHSASRRRCASTNSVARDDGHCRAKRRIARFTTPTSWLFLPNR